jgi:hypothetical protein
MEGIHENMPFAGQEVIDQTAREPGGRADS